MLLLSEGQAGEAKEPSHKPMVLGEGEKQLRFCRAKLALRFYRRRFKHLDRK
jgi:hypothetical protein